MEVGSMPVVWMLRFVVLSWDSFLGDREIDGLFLRKYVSGVEEPAASLYFRELAILFPFFFSSFIIRWMDGC